MTDVNNAKAPFRHHRACPGDPASGAGVDPHARSSGLPVMMTGNTSCPPLSQPSALFESGLRQRQEKMPLTSPLIGLYSIRSIRMRATSRGVFDVRIGCGGRRFRGVTHPGFAAAEVAWFRRACRSSQGLPLAVSCDACQTRNGETEEARQRRIDLVSPPGVMRRKAEAHRSGAPGKSPASSRRLPRLHFLLLVQAARGRRNSPGVPARPFFLQKRTVQAASDKAPACRTGRE
jgi:hypothetical protein